MPKFCKHGSGLEEQRRQGNNYQENYKYMLKMLTLEGHAKYEMGAQENLILSHSNNKGTT